LVAYANFLTLAKKAKLNERCFAVQMNYEFLAPMQSL
jgi:hypothetical protein